MHCRNFEKPNYFFLSLFGWLFVVAINVLVFYCKEWYLNAKVRSNFASKIDKFVCHLKKLKHNKKR